MIISLITLTLHLPMSESLKDKRSEVLSLKMRLKEKFNISIIESSLQDNIKEAELSIAYLSHDSKMADRMRDKIEKFVFSHSSAKMILIDYEIF